MLGIDCKSNSNNPAGNYGLDDNLDESPSKNQPPSANRTFQHDSKTSAAKSGPFSPTSEKKADNVSGISHNPSARGILSQPTHANEMASVAELKQKIADLKAELDLSPRQFEDKLLYKLREEI